MTDETVTVDQGSAAEGREADVDTLLGLLATVADRVDALDTLTGEDAGAQENRTIRGSRARLARAEARQARAEVGEVRERARALSRSADAARHRSIRLAPPVPEGGPGDRGSLTTAAAVGGRTVDDQRRRLVEGARQVSPDVCWSELAVLGEDDLETWSTGELTAPATAALVAGLRAAVLDGADSVLIEEDDHRWPAVATGGVRSVLALAAGPGALVLASSEAATFDDSARLVAGRLAERAGVALAGDDPSSGRPDDARRVLDAACAVLGRHLGIASDATFEALVEVARAVGEPVLAAAERVLAALVVRAPAAGGVADPEPAVLRRAVSYIEDHVDEDVSLEDIAAAAGIGHRGLQQLFRRHHDVTPTQYVRHVRLDRAHTELQAADASSGETVGAVAARYHFGNPGRFSVAYRERFGISPSRTLRA